MRHERRSRYDHPVFLDYLRAEAACVAEYVGLQLLRRADARAS